VPLAGACARWDSKGVLVRVRADGARRGGARLGGGSRPRFDVCRRARPGERQHSVAAGASSPSSPRSPEGPSRTCCSTRTRKMRGPGSGSSASTHARRGASSTGGRIRQRDRRPRPRRTWRRHWWSVRSRGCSAKAGAGTGSFAPTNERHGRPRRGPGEHLRDWCERARGFDGPRVRGRVSAEVPRHSATASASRPSRSRSHAVTPGRGARSAGSHGMWRPTCHRAPSRSRFRSCFR